MSAKRLDINRRTALERARLKPRQDRFLLTNPAALPSSYATFDFVDTTANQNARQLALWPSLPSVPGSDVYQKSSALCPPQQLMRTDLAWIAMVSSSSSQRQIIRHSTASMSSFHTREETSNGPEIELDSSPRSNPTRTRILLGLKASAPLADEHKDLEHHDLVWSRIRLALREPFAEFFGTFIMVLFGDGSVAQVLLSAGQVGAPGKNGNGNYQSISWGYDYGFAGRWTKIKLSC